MIFHRLFELCCAGITIFVAFRMCTPLSCIRIEH